MADADGVCNYGDVDVVDVREKRENFLGVGHAGCAMDVADKEGRCHTVTVTSNWRFHGRWPGPLLRDWQQGARHGVVEAVSGDGAGQGWPSGGRGKSLT